MSTTLSEIQLDALRELANISSGTAATALSQLLGREVELSVPKAFSLSLADAVDACGPPEAEVTGVVVGVSGDLTGVVLLMLGSDESARLCAMLGAEPNTEFGDSALREIGNILATSYLTGLASMTGTTLMPDVPDLQTDMLGAIVATLLARTAGSADQALMLDSVLEVSGEPCTISFLLLPTEGGINQLLAPLGLAEAA